MRLLFVGLLYLVSTPTQLSSSRTMAITIDDLPTASVLGNAIDRAEKTTRDLLAAIRRANVPAIGFVNERKIETSGKEDPRRVALLQQWLDARLELGNHTYSHPDLHRTELKAFQDEVLRGEVVTKRLLAAKGQKPRYFRHPFLHTGRSLEVRDGLLTFLKEHGYAVAPVTVDNSDYSFAAAYDRSVEAGDASQAARVVAAYLAYMEAVVAYYEQQSVAIVGREMAQTLLLHANALNAATFDQLVERIRKRGYAFVSLSKALEDPTYELKDDYVGAAGMTWLHRWALTQGKKGIFAGEPVVPDWIQKLSDVR
ncbi:MAG: polysaccharide deacetylase family protein [Acidobacteriota bacterium]|nr:polysaccharide deacetylase family protein [Acidobacteriota bacterium]